MQKILHILNRSQLQHVMLSLITVAILSNCSAPAVSTSKTNTYKTSDKIISVMAYNVENFFDTIHDANRNDFTYLPKADKTAPEVQKFCAAEKDPFYQRECYDMDWSEDVLKAKMEHIADSVLQINGIGPDILILEEVENQRVLDRLNKEYLQKAGYITATLIEGEDRRGIDIGVLSRFPLASDPRLVLIDFTPDKNDPSWKAPKTRGIMHVPLKLPSGDVLYVHGVHLPSQANPVQERIDAVNTLNKLNEQFANKTMAVVGGDFNITEAENQKDGLFSKLLSSHWLVSHLIGCFDCKGTHGHRGEWGFLDALILTKSLGPDGKAPYMVDLKSIQVPKHGKHQLRSNGFPNRFDNEKKTGTSDHLPIYLELKPRS